MAQNISANPANSYRPKPSSLRAELVAGSSAHLGSPKKKDEEYTPGTYWKIYGQQGKWNWHARHVKTFDKKSNNEKETRRKCSRHYFFTIKGKEVKVCQTMYLSTLDISDGSVITSYKKIGPDGALSPDKRGQFKTRRPRQISEHLKDSVREHISMFPRVEAHYTV